MVIAPPIVCADGTRVSVQANSFTYCTPRTDEGPHTHVEVGFPTARPRWWDEYAQNPTTLDTVAAYVPVELVEEFIAEHGGRA